MLWRDRFFKDIMETVGSLSKFVKDDAPVYRYKKEDKQ